MKASLKFVAMIAVLLAVLWLAGCTADDSSPVNIAEPPARGVFLKSEDELLAAFRSAYEEMNAEALTALLHPDFVTLLQASTQDIFPDLGPEIDLSEETWIAGRMFSGEVLEDPDGETVAAVAGISFDQLEQAAPWRLSPPTDPIPLTQFGLFEVAISMERPGWSSLMTVGQIKFYVVQRDTVLDGEALSYWQMIGQQDLTQDNAKASETVAWGSLKGLFR